MDLDDSPRKAGVAGVHGFTGLLFPERRRKDPSHGRGGHLTPEYCGDPEHWKLSPLELESCLLLGTSCALGGHLHLLCGLPK